jgi:plasmid stabilization system protein ParE
MGRVRVDLAQSARDDLADIIEWYTSQGVPQVGRRLVMEVRDRLQQLDAFPDSGKLVPEFESPWLRELEHPPFRIVYRRDEDAITVARVWRSERMMDPDLGGNA